MKRLLIFSLFFGLWIHAMDNGNGTELEQPSTRTKSDGGGDDPNPKKPTDEENGSNCCQGACCCSCSIL